MVGDFNAPFLSIDSLYRQKPNRETPVLNDIIISFFKMDLTDNYRIFHLS